MDTYKFHASMGWFEKFKIRFSLHHVELVREAASADHDAVKNYPLQLMELINVKGFMLKQVFNADKTALF